MVQTLFGCYLQHPGLIVLAVCFDTVVNNLRAKTSQGEQMFLEIKVYLANESTLFKFNFEG